MKADYAGALAQRHTVIPVIHEVFGGWARQACILFRQLARTHNDEIDPCMTSWAARSFTAYHAQRISVAIHTRSADEIQTNIRCDLTAATRGRRGAKRARVQAGTRRVAQD